MLKALLKMAAMLLVGAALIGLFWTWVLDDETAIFLASFLTGLPYGLVVLFVALDREWINV